MDAQDSKFIEGFNGGYLLEKFEPSLLTKVLKDLDLSNDYVSGLSSGQKEYQQERTRLELENMARLRAQDNDKDLDIQW